MTWAAGIAAQTSTITVASTCHTPVIHPTFVAKAGATVDAIANGRFALNVVMGWYPAEIGQFGLEPAEHDIRYEQGAEWLDALKRLWTLDEPINFDGKWIKIMNPIGIKLGPKVLPDDAVRLVETLNPTDEAGKIVLITRMGAKLVEKALPPVIEAVKRAGRRVLWVSDPMHGNMSVTSSGLKTRSFDDILREVELSFDVHTSCKSYLGGVHFELTGEDVTECTGGAAGITEDDLDRNYATMCDPRLNYRQALEMGLRIAKRMAADKRASK